MPTQTFPDGFPITAMDAINFSYFLSDVEKAEWTEWIKTANDEQQNELIETLHAIWQENQKEIVPGGFNNPTTTVTVEQTQTPTPTNSGISTTTPRPQPATPRPTTSPSPVPAPVPNPVQTQPKPAITKTETVVENNEPKTTPTIPTPSSVETATIAQQTQTQPKPTPQIPTNTNQNNQPKTQITPEPSTQKTPDQDFRNQKPEITQANTQNTQKDPRKFESRNRQQNQQNPNNTNQNQTPAQNQNNRPAQTNSQPQNTTPTPRPQPEINFTKIKETATEQELKTLVGQYKTDSLELEKFDQETNQKRTELSKKSDESMQKLVLKMSTILGNFESVSGYLEEITDKMLKMRDVITNEAAENQKFRSNLEIKNLTLDEKVEFNVRDVDRVFRELRDLKDEMRRNDQDLRAKINTNNADVYQPGEAINQKIDLLNSKLVSLQNQINGQGITNNTREEIKDNQDDIISTFTKNKVEQEKPKSSDIISTSKKSTTIDLRNIV
jgi:hypothetical protein